MDNYSHLTIDQIHHEAQKAESENRLIDAYQLYLEGSKRNDALCCYNLALCYFDGWGIDKDSKKAVECFKEAEKHQRTKASAHIMLGQMYLYGIGVEKNADTACKYLKSAAEAGKSVAAQKLAEHYYSIGEYDEAVKYLKLAEGDHSEEVAIYLGSCYLNGYGVEKDYGQALKYYQISADAGNPIAMMNLGYMYNNGLGTPIDYEKSFKWYMNAYRYPDAPKEVSHIIGSAFLRGRGTVKDPKIAFFFLKKAVDDHVTGAMTDLGYCYLNGFGTEKNTDKAFELFSRAASLGDTTAMRCLAVMYLEGECVKKSESKALKWLELAKNMGDKEAETLYGKVLSNSWMAIGIKKSPELLVRMMLGIE